MTFYYFDFRQSESAEMEQIFTFFLVVTLSSYLMYSTYGEYITLLSYVAIDTLE